MRRRAKKFLKRYVPQAVLKAGRDGLLRAKIIRTRRKQGIALQQVISKQRINVIFLLIHPSVWKYDTVYHLFSKNERYKLTVVICPFLKNGEAEMWEVLKKSERMCNERGYSYINTWDASIEEWKDIKLILKPDIVFFSNPHSITRAEYCIDNYLDYLTCYVPYSIRSDHLSDLAFNSEFQQLTWMNFYESEIHKKIAEECSFNRGRNVKVTGYPTLDLMNHKQGCFSKSDRKIIVWAPHWTIPKSDILNRSCFLVFCDYFVELANKYADSIDVIMRPHPFLRNTLYELPGWGKEKTDSYFGIWESTPNLSINEGDYVELFASSDLLVHDSVSFLAEYLVTGRPAIFTKRAVELDPPFNEFGKLCLSAHYVCSDISELDQMISDILFKGIDAKRDSRREIVKSYLSQSNEASVNIYDEINAIVG